MSALFRPVVLLLVLALLASCTGSRMSGDVREARLLMGTMVEITIAGADERNAREAANAAYAEMARLSGMMNHYDPASVVSEINRQAGQHPVLVPRELMAVLKMAQSLATETNGAFDITIGALQGWRFDPEHPAMPDSAALREQLSLVDYRGLNLDEKAGTAFLRRKGMRMDLGGIAKLYILHAGMEVLQRYGVRRAMINGGGDVEVIGGQDEPWRIGVRDPQAPGLLWGVVEIGQGFIVSSGDYERYFMREGRRYHHILDPRTGYPSQGLRHVTVVGRQLHDINGVTAAAMVLGLSQARKLVQARGLEAVLIGNHQTWVSPGLHLAPATSLP